MRIPNVSGYAVHVSAPSRSVMVQVQDRLRALDAPTSPGDVHEVGNEVSTGALDHPGGDRTRPGPVVTLNEC
jgi:hypothetical protein